MFVAWFWFWYLLRQAYYRLASSINPLTAKILTFLYIIRYLLLILIEINLLELFSIFTCTISQQTSIIPCKLSPHAIFSSKQCSKVASSEQCVLLIKSRNPSTCWPTCRPAPLVRASLLNPHLFVIVTNTDHYYPTA